MLYIGLVDDQVLFRQSVVSYIAQHYGERVVLFEANDCAEFVSVMLNQRDNPQIDLILVNVTKDVVDGISFVKRSFPSSKILGLSAYFSRYLAIELLKRGVNGYLSKSASIRVLMEAIGCVMNDELYVEPLLAEYSSIQPPREFSRSEALFLRYCISELTYKEIAVKMCLSYKTIDNIRDKLFKALNVKSRTGLALYAVRSGLEEQNWAGLL
jgi:DNA-binding NarL/FixJ family response regulator